MDDAERLAIRAALFVGVVEPGGGGADDRDDVLVRRRELGLGVVMEELVFSLTS